MKNYKFRCQPQKIRTRFLIVMVFTSVLPLILVGAISYAFSSRMQFTQIISIDNDNLAVYNRNLDRVFADILKKINGVLVMDQESSRNDSVLDILQETRSDYTQPNNYDFYQYSMRTDRTMKAIINDDPYIKRVYVNDDVLFTYHRNYNTQNPSPSIDATSHTDYRQQAWYASAQEKNGAQVFVGYDVLALDTLSQEQNDIFTCWKELISPKNFSHIGHLAFFVDKEILRQTLPQETTAQGRSYAIVDNTQQTPILVFESGSVEHIEQIIARYYAGEQSDTVMIGALQNKTSGWDILTIIDKNEVYKSANTIGKITLWFIILVTLINVFVFVMLNRSIMKPLYKLKDMILLVATHENPTLTDEFGTDEIGQIGHEFKTLINDNLSLKHNLYRSVSKQKEAEIRSLQAQINPHFLYNTLDIMYWMAKMKSQEDLAQMTISLSDIFRFSLDRGDRFVELSQDFQNLEKYLLLQKKRFGARLHYRVSFTPEVSACSVLKLLIQPIVENALYHGLEPKIEPGEILIDAIKQQDYLEITVIDNGVGIDPQKGLAKGFGITNIEERIALHYGTHAGYGVDFQTNPQGGTIATIRLPYRSNNPLDQMGSPL